MEAGFSGFCRLFRFIPHNRIRPMISDKLRKSECCSGNLLSFSDNTIGEELSRNILYDDL